MYYVFNILLKFVIRNNSKASCRFILTFQIKQSLFETFQKAPKPNIRVSEIRNREIHKKFPFTAY